jgi:hypothetical protein
MPTSRVYRLTVADPASTLPLDPDQGDEGTMTSDAATAELTEPQPLHCYRHPDRETWVRCGRCDQPICMNCAMQGPVGMRCKSCGKPARDALASMTALQVVAVLGVTLGAGLLVGYLAMQFGWFVLLLGFFAGRFTVDALDHTIGMKRGPRMLALVVVGLLAGSLVGGGIGVWWLWREVTALGDAGSLPFDVFLVRLVPQILMALGATITGAYLRLR